MTAFLLAVFLTLSSASGRSFYVDSARGKDSNSGTSPSSPWATTTKLCNYGQKPGYRPGDTIYLAGTFHSNIWMNLDTSYGSPQNPLRITSTDPASPAVIDVENSSGIAIDSSSNTPGGLGIVIDHLIIKGNGGLDASKNPTSGILVYHRAPGDLVGFNVSFVNVSGFGQAGLFTCRYNETGKTGVIRNVRVTDSVFHHNLGNAGIKTPAGSGIVLSGVFTGLIERVEAYGNGANNDNPGGGPVGIWAYDSDSITIRNCTSHDNLSKNNDGGGFDLDGGVTNSVIEDCVSYNNAGPGYEVCSYVYDSCNAACGSYNNLMRNSYSYGDGNFKNIWSLTSYPMGRPIVNMTFTNITVVVTSDNCVTWGQSANTHSGVFVEPANSQDPLTTVNFINMPVTCRNQTVNLNLACDSRRTPQCVERAGHVVKGHRQTGRRFG